MDRLSDNDDGEVFHHRDEAMLSPWALCGMPMPPVPPPGARECRECREYLDAMRPDDEPR